VSCAYHHGCAQRRIVSGTVAMVASALRISSHSNQPLPWETPNEMLRYPRHAPRRFRADQMPPRVCLWNRTIASKLSSTNIIKAVGGKRYWPHLLVCCLSRGGPRGHCQYPTDRVPLHTRLKSSPTAPDPTPGTGGLRRHHMSHATGPTSRCGRALALWRVLWHRTRLTAGEGSIVAMCPMIPDPPPSVAGLWRCHVPCGSQRAMGHKQKGNIQPVYLLGWAHLPLRRARAFPRCLTSVSS
jgi:hypothetical protein